MTRRDRIPATAAERMLAGEVRDGSPLSNVLAAAGGPGHRREMAGLDAARTAFLRAYPASLHPRSVRSLSAATRSAAARLLVLKAIAAVGSVSLVGGAAFAAADGNLLGGQPDRPSHQRPAVPGPASGSAVNGGGGGGGGGAQSAGYQPNTAANAHPAQPAANGRSGENPHSANSRHANAAHPDNSPAQRRPNDSHGAKTPTPPEHTKTTPTPKPSDHELGRSRAPTTPAPGGGT